MRLFKTAELSPKQIERRDRTRAKGRKNFILYRGILGFGGFVFIINSIFEWCYNFAWHVPNGGMFWFAIIAGLTICPVTGYFWAAWMWNKYFENSLP